MTTYNEKDCEDWRNDRKVYMSANPTRNKPKGEWIMIFIKKNKKKNIHITQNKRNHKIRDNTSKKVVETSELQRTVL